jgi:hypothetical protein
MLFFDHSLLSGDKRYAHWKNSFFLSHIPGNSLCWQLLSLKYSELVAATIDFLSEIPLKAVFFRFKPFWDTFRLLNYKEKSRYENF